jgi:ABC-type nitrate/sulfonate/bicarbonate transport system ATPase subunit
MNVYLKNINFGYNQEKQVLTNITLDVDEGEIIAIAGISGSGKTTLLKILAGIIKKNKEYIFSGDIKVNNKSAPPFCEPGDLAYMFQERTLFPNLTVYGNIALPLQIIKAKKINERVNSIIDAVGLKDYKNTYIKHLSGGMKTRVELARTFITNPKIILLDEPFGDLDIGWKLELYKVLTQLNTLFHSTIIIVTHDITEAIILAKKIIVLSQKGEVIKKAVNKISAPSELTSDSLNDFLNKSNEFYLDIQSEIINDILNHKKP